jgi:hypothetical protein
MPLELQGRQFMAFQEALLSAFPTYMDFSQALMFGLNVALPVIAANDGMANVAFNTIAYFNQRGQLDSLLAAALEFRPNNPKLKRFAMELSLTSSKGPEARLESLLNKGMLPEPYSDWKKSMQRAESWVARIEIPEGEPFGTGFLVGPRHLLTNCHVAEIVEKTGAEPRSCGARFQYQDESDDARAFVHFAADWEAHRSSVAELDYALLRLDVVEGTSWAKPRKHTFETDEVLIILQHPQADPLRVAMGAFQKLTESPPRVQYAVNTEAGSSGSPVLTSRWEPVALHQAGGKDTNAGIPLEAIWSDLAAKGIAAELTAGV